VGVLAVGKLVEGKLGWIYREQPTCDHGVDAHIEICDEDGKPTGRLLALQIKCGPRYLKEQTPDAYIYRGKTRHLEYWQGHALPVVLILYDDTKDVAYWNVIDPSTVERTERGWKTELPFHNTLGPEAEERLRAMAEGTPYQRRLSALVLAKPWMEMVAAGEAVRLEVQQWVNKSSGRGSLRLFLQEDLERRTSRAKTIQEWPFVMFPGLQYRDAMRWLFPWAELQVDLDFYEPYDEEKHDDACGIWDSEDGCYIMHDPEFSEWREGLSTFRPYQVAAGEVAMYRFELSLNEVGRAFLLLDGYLNSGAGTDAGADD
jgi:hypothetical protein